MQYLGHKNFLSCHKKCFSGVFFTAGQFVISPTHEVASAINFKGKLDVVSRDYFDVDVVRQKRKYLLN